MSMSISFDEIPATSRIWIYQSDKLLSPMEKAIAQERTNLFVESWKAHGKPLKASFKIFFDRFIIFAVDDSYYSASGCSIDSSVQFLRSLEQDLNIQLLDRTTIAYHNNGEILLANIKDLKEEITNGRIKPATIIFNNAITTLADLEDKWQQPASKTWVARYFPAEV